jgi:hypothetical protein
MTTVNIIKVPIYEKEMRDYEMMGLLKGDCLNLQTCEIYRGRYKATLQGNILTLSHIEYDVVYKYTLHYEFANDDFRRTWIWCGNRVKAGRILNNIAYLKMLTIVKYINN